nr:aa3-type cytochrome c oxidase subunit IV [uncultured Cohaesibacter sp.]
MNKELNPVMDYEEHEKTYDLFVALFQYGTIGCLLVVVFMAIFLL